MTDNKHIIDVDSSEYEDAPPGLRDAYKALRKQFDAVTSERDGFRSQVNAAALSDVLKGFKNPSLVQSQILASVSDPTDRSAVDAWLAANGDDFAKAEGAPAPDNQQQPAAQVSPEVQAQLQQHDLISQMGNHLQQPADMSKLDLAKSQITPDMTKEQVREVLLKSGL